MAIEERISAGAIMALVIRGIIAPASPDPDLQCRGEGPFLSVSYNSPVSVRASFIEENGLEKRFIAQSS